MEKLLVRDISMIFRSNEREVVALRNINFSVPAHEFASIVGPSGCGKSSLLYIIGNLIQPSEGEILIDGIPSDRASISRGFVFQEYALFPWKTIIENIEFGLKIRKRSAAERQKIARDHIELVGLKGFEDHYPHELSGGMKQRAAIARALAYNPDILLMDEPFGSLDSQTRVILQKELLNIWNKTKKTIIFVTHSVEEAIVLSDRVLILTFRPGSIKVDIKIDLPRPRDLNDLMLTQEFNSYRHEVWEYLREEVDKTST